ncbi:MAG: hypothetical protein ACYC99_01950 [Candidatus Geothermincolia bacterium]
MSILTSAWVKKAICAFLVAAFVLFACLSSNSVIGPQPAKAQFGEFAVAAIGKLLGGIFSKTLDYLFNGLNDDGPDVEKILDEINATIQAVSAELQMTEAQLRNIFAQLMEMEFYQLVLNATDSASEIESYWNDEYIPRFNNKEPGTVPAETFQNFIDAWKGPTASPPLEYDFNMIRDVLCHNSSSRGAMDQYTDMAMSQIAAGGAQDFSTSVESTNGVGIVAERPMYFNYNGQWNGGHTQAGTPAPQTDYYFAEGTTRPAFDSFMCIQNPGNTTAKVNLVYMRGDGTNKEQAMSVAPHSRATVNSGDVIDRADSAASDFSVHLESTNGVRVIAERPMYFDYKTLWDGGHCNLGLNAPAEKFFLAEGTCRYNFETFLCIQNPGDKPTSVKATYLRANGAVAGQSVVVPARSRSTLRPSDILGHGDDTSYDFATRVETLDGGKIVVERPMYFNYKNAWLGGHCESGRVSLADSFYFAEGCVRPNFHSYICVANPEDTPSNVKVTFMLGDGTTKEHSRVVAPHSRATVNVSDVLGQGDGPAYDFSCRAQTTDGSKISAERVMYFDYQGPRTAGGPGWSGGHCEMGLTETSTKFYFAEGTLRPGFSPYMCIQNPESKAAQVQITYMKSDGDVMRQGLEVPAHTRSTIDVAAVWNTLQASGKGGSNDALVHQYMGLEQLFSKFLHDQVMAVDMSVEVMNYQDPSRVTSGNYLSGTVAPAMQQEAMVFLDNAERLVMSQASLATSTGTNQITLPDQGQQILDRANFMVNMVYQQSVVGLSPVLMGRVITTADVNASGAKYPLTARDKQTQKELTPGSVWAVPQDTSMNPCYPTIWRKVNETGEIKNYFYNCWDSTLKTVNYSSAMSVTRYTFSGPDIVKGHSYDILDANKNVLATSTVNSYDDEFNLDDAGENVFGGFEVALSTNGSDAFMNKAGWTETQAKDTNYDHQKVYSTYDINTLAPKTVKAECKDDNDAASGFSGSTTITRSFTAGTTANAQVNYNVDFDGTLKVHQIMDGGSQSIDYAVELIDSNTSASLGKKSSSLKLDKNSSHETLTLDKTEAGSFSASLIVGHTYHLNVYSHVNIDNGAYYWGPIDCWMTGTVHDAYIDFLQDQ